MPYQWKGRDGEIYTVTEVTDKHLLSAHRLFREHVAEAEGKLTLAQAQKNTSWVRKIEEFIILRLEAVGEFEREMRKRDLSPLPLRTPEEQQQQRLAWEQRQAERKQQERQHRVERVHVQVAINKELEMLHEELARLQSLKQQRELLEAQRQQQEAKLQALTAANPTREASDSRRILHIATPKSNDKPD